MAQKINGDIENQN